MDFAPGYNAEEGGLTLRNKILNEKQEMQISKR